MDDSMKIRNVHIDKSKIFIRLVISSVCLKFNKKWKIQTSDISQK